MRQYYTKKKKSIKNLLAEIFLRYFEAFLILEKFSISTTGVFIKKKKIIFSCLYIQRFWQKMYGIMMGKKSYHQINTVFVLKN